MSAPRTWLVCLLLAALCAVHAQPALARAGSGRITVLVDGLPAGFDVPPQIQNGRTLVPFRAIAEALAVRVQIPLRFFSEAFGCQVAWDGATAAISIRSPVRPMTVVGFYALGDAETSSWTDLFGTPFPAAGRLGAA